MDLYQHQRYELKYRIPLRVVGQIRQFVASYLEPDVHSIGRPDWAYPVHSLYLDSPDMRLFQATVNGDRNRYKLRVRYYTQDPQSPVFFEVKARRNSIIRKTRAMVRRPSLRDLLTGRPPTAGDLHEDDAVQFEALLRFCNHSQGLRAAPKTHVGYLREAWLSPDNSLRVTMDRSVGAALNPWASLSADLGALKPVFGRQVILEIKFTNRYPLWLVELVRNFGLCQGGAAKYVDGVIALGEHFFLSATARDEVRRRMEMRQAVHGPEVKAALAGYL